ADGGGRVLGLARRRPAAQLPRLGGGDAAHDGRTVASGAGPGAGTGRPDARPLPVDLLLQPAGPRGLPGPAGLGRARRPRHGPGRAPADRRPDRSTVDPPAGGAAGPAMIVAAWVWAG